MDNVTAQLAALIKKPFDITGFFNFYSGSYNPAADFRAFGDLLRSSKILYDIEVSYHIKRKRNTPSEYARFKISFELEDKRWVYNCRCYITIGHALLDVLGWSDKYKDHTNEFCEIVRTYELLTEADVSVDNFINLLYFLTLGK